MSLNHCGDRGGNPVHFGEGTRLTVLEKGQEVLPPKVTIFAPSKKELKDHQKATIVCLASGFYPDHVNLTWSKNGKNIREGVKTENPTLVKYSETMKTYSLISRLRIIKADWQNSANEFQCTVDFYDENKKTPYSATIQGEVGGGKPGQVPYLRDSNLGKLIYILLISKSALYGAFVMGLMLRKKLKHEKAFD